MKITKIIIAVALATAILTACGEDADITINKVNSGYEFESNITVVPEGTSIDSTVSEDTSSNFTSSKDTSSDTSSTDVRDEIPASARTVAEYAAEFFYPQSAEAGFTLYFEGVELVGGYECYIIEVFDSSNTFLATYAISTEYEDVYFAYDTKSEKYRIMLIDDEIWLGDFADTLVTHGVYTNQPSGYTFSYDGEPEITTDFNTTVFEAPLWLVAIEGEVPTATLDFTVAEIREAQEETVLREMVERLGLVFDWALGSDTVELSGNPFVRRPFFATYGDTEIEIGTVYYGYADNGMFYKIVAFSLGETNSVSELLDAITFTECVEGGTVRDNRTQATTPIHPGSADENGDSSIPGPTNDRPFGW